MTPFYLNNWIASKIQPGMLHTLIVAGLLTGQCIWAGPAIAAPPTPYLSGVYLADIANATDNNGNGYYETFDFNIRIDADIYSGSATVAAKVICTTTGQTWNTNPWTIYGIEIDWCTVPFNESSFRGFISGPTSLYFTIELWDGSFSRRYAVTSTVIDQPFKAEPAPFIRQAVIGNVRDTVDENLDGYFEFFQFDLQIDADTVPGSSAAVAAKIICPTTGQSWRTGPWTITGSAVDYHIMTFDQSAFTGKITAPTNLDFTVELWNPDFTARYDTSESVANEPFKAGPLPLISDARLMDVSGTIDSNGNGYFEAFRFKIGIDADMPGGSANVAAKIVCMTTGQTWTTGPWTISGWAIDYHTLPFDQTNFSGYLNGQVDLYFTVELWDPTFTRMYNSTASIMGQPVKAEQTYTISGSVWTVAGSPLPGVTLSGLPGSPSTDTSGHYNTAVLSGWSGASVPTKSGYDFCPVSRSYSNVGANYFTQDYVGTPSNRSVTIPSAKQLPDESEVRVSGIVTAVFTDLFYIEEESRTAGIRVRWGGISNPSPSVRDRVSIPGIIRGSQAERYISAVCASSSGTGTAVGPLGVRTSSVGGTGFFFNQQTASGQPGVLGGLGPNNIGLLVRVWGRVTHVETGVCYLDDGCNLNDGSGHTGLRVEGPIPTQIQEGSHAVVTGIASCIIQPGAGLRPVILATDIYSP